MDSDDIEKIRYLDSIIEAARNLSSLTETDGFKEFIQILIEIRTSAFSDILSSEKEPDHALRTRIGYAQAINSILNAVTDRISEGSLAEEKKVAILTQIKKDEELDIRLKESMRQQGFGGVL